MHAADIAQERLVDTAGKVETEVGILRITHVGEVLMGERLQDGTRHGGSATLGVVAVVELAHGPGSILAADVGSDGVEQLVGEVA